MLTIHKYKCLSCGNKFVVPDGDLYFRPVPSKGETCPHCGSKETVLKDGLFNWF